MPIVNGRYVNPNWVNDTAPAMNATEMNAISDTLERVPIANGGTGGTTVAEARQNLGLGNTAGALPIANGGTGAITAQDARTNLGFSGAGGLVPISLGGTSASTAEQARTNLGFTGAGGIVPISLGGTGATDARQARINLGFTAQGGTLGGILPISLGGTGAASVQVARQNLGFTAGNTLPINLGGTGATSIDSIDIVNQVTAYKWGRLMLLSFRADNSMGSAQIGMGSTYAPVVNMHFTCPIYSSSGSGGMNPKEGYASVFIQTTGNIYIQVYGANNGYPRFDVLYLCKS